MCDVIRSSKAVLALAFFVVLSASVFSLLFLDRTSLWFSEDLPSPDQVAQWSDRELDENLFRLSRWEAFLGGAQYRRFVYSQIHGLHLPLSEPFHFLEIGVGVGAFARVVLSKYPASTGYGIDVVPGAIAIASKVLPSDRINVSVGTMLKLPHHNETFDVVFVPGAICYLTKMADVRRAVAEFARVLKTGGGTCLSMVASDTSEMGSCNVRIPKDYWLHDALRENHLEVVSMDEMDSWNLPHAFGRYSTCLRKQM